MRTMRTILPADELNRLEPKYDYRLTDKTIRYLTLLIIQEFRKAKGRVGGMTERELIRYADQLYGRLYGSVQRSYLKLAKQQYRSAGGHLGSIDADWVLGVLNDYDPVLKRVFDHEIDRKQGIFIESVLSTANRAGEVDVRMRELSRLVNQGALDITDRAVRQAFDEDDDDDGGSSVYVWITARDEKVCDECHPRHGRLYRKQDIPTKHPNCRCIVMPVEVD